MKLKNGAWRMHMHSCKSQNSSKQNTVKSKTQLHLWNEKMKIKSEWSVESAHVESAHTPQHVEQCVAKHKTAERPGLWNEKIPQDETQ